MRIAGRQWGAIARSQALKAGMTSHQIAHRLTTGQWRRAARGVYVVAGTPGEALWDLVDSAICRKLVRPSRLVRASGEAWAEARGRRRRDLEKLERALDVRRSGAPAGSPPEARLQRKLIEWGSPRAERQVEVYDDDGQFVARADVGIRELKVLFEYDSDEHHGPRCWVGDDARKERLEQLGWTVIVVDRFDLRPSGTRLRDELDRVVQPRFLRKDRKKRGALPVAA
jgi:very-short-patch-repair endonuclease